MTAEAEAAEPDADLFFPKAISSYQAKLLRFRWSDAEMQALVNQAGKVQTPLRVLYHPGTTAVERWRRLLKVLLNPKLGHLAQMLAAGLMGTLRLPGEVLKGRSVKTTQVIKTAGQEKHITKWVAHIVRVTDAGVETYRGAAALPFLEKNAARLAALLKKKISAYGYATTPEETAHIRRLSPRPRPGDDEEEGLYDNQVESAIAALRALEEYNVAHLIAEMGYGKTTVAAAVIDTASYYPAYTMCPPHMVNKWVRELQGVIPDVKPVIVNDLGELLAVIKHYQPGDKLVVVASWSTTSQGPGWEPALNRRYTLPVYDNAKLQEKSRQPFKDALAAYKTVRAQLRTAASAHADADNLAALRQQVAELRQAALSQATAYETCPHCGQEIERVGKSRHTLHCDCEVVYPAALPTADLAAAAATSREEE